MNRGWKRKKENEVCDEMEFHFTYNKRACWWKLSTWTGSALHCISHIYLIPRKADSFTPPTPHYFDSHTHLFYELIVT
jgi:hypothetical protein